MSNGSIVLDDALDNFSNLLGQMIVVAGKEDASGFRRALAAAVDADDYERFNRMLPVKRHVFNNLKTARLE